MQRKGLWPSKSSAEPGKTELVAVEVMADRAASEALVCRVTAPNVWAMELRQWPDAKWLAALMGAGHAS